MPFNIVYLLLGSNMGSRTQLLENAIEQINLEAGKVILASHTYETAAWGNEEQQPFLNVALKIQTENFPEQLLNILLHIEKELGRTRKENWEPRLIDIDILLFNNEVINKNELTIPHHFMHLRRFTLEPLAEIAGEVVHPVLNKTISELLLACPDKLPVTMLTHAL